MRGGKEQALEHLRKCLALRPERTVEERARSLIERLESGKVEGN
jgi:hypothetical protein